MALPTRQRRNRIGLDPDAFCSNPLDPIKRRMFGPLPLSGERMWKVVGGEVDNVEHTFCSCVGVREAWGWLRRLILNLLPSSGASVSNFELIMFLFPVSSNDVTISWLISTYCNYAWYTARRQKKNLDVHNLRVYLKYHYQAHQLTRRSKLVLIDF